MNNSRSTQTLSRTALSISLSLLVAATLAACGGKGATSITLSGSITGLTTGSLTLANGNSVVTLPANTTGFTIPAQIPLNGGYNVVVAAQPAGMNCTVANGVGVAGSSDINTVVVTCVANHVVGGSIIGLTAAGLQLVNGSEIVVVPAGATTFGFLTQIANTRSYGVTVLQQPTPQTCSVQNGAGYINGIDVTNVQVTCQ